MTEVFDELLKLLLGLPLYQGLLLIDATLGLWIDDWLGSNRHSLQLSLTSVPSDVEFYVKQYVQPKLNAKSSLRKENLSLIEYGYCMVLAFHMRMGLLSKRHIDKISNVPVAGSVDEDEITKRARILANHIYHIDIDEALAFIENLVVSWAQRYDADDLSRYVLERYNHFLPEGKKLAELPDESKAILRCYIPHFLAELTEH